jgi:hypothetical protein
MIAKYMKMDGKVYEVLGKGWGGYPICKLCPGLKDIPEDKPLREVREMPFTEEIAKEFIEDVKAVEEQLPKRRGRRKA